MKARKDLYILFQLMCFLGVYYGGKNEDITGKIRVCEQNSLRIGTRLADEFNAPMGNEDADARLHQDYITEHLGFAPTMVGGMWKSGGKFSFNLALFHTIESEQLPLCTCKARPPKCQTLKHFKGKAVG